MSAVLQPQEITRRRAALARHFGNSAFLVSAPDSTAAGVISTPAVVTRWNSPARETAPALFWPLRSVFVSYEYARRYAMARGMATRRGAVDLRRVNAFRSARGLAPFAVRGEG